MHVEADSEVMKGQEARASVDEGSAAEANDTAAVEAGYLRAMRADGAQIATLLAKARALRLAGDHAGGLPILRAAARCRPKGVMVLADLGVSLWAVREVDEAEAVLRRVLALEPGHGAVLGVLGRIARHNQDHEASLALFQRSLTQRPEDTGLREDVARALMQLDRHEEAEAVWQGLLDEAPDNARILIALAQIRRGRGDFEAALTLYRRALEHSAGHAGLRDDIGRMLMRLNRMEEAAALWLALLADAPATPRYLLALAQVRRMQGDHEAAVAVAQEAIAAAPSAEAYAALGGALLRSLETQEAAEAAFLAAIELEPDYAPALVQLGMLARSRVEDDAALVWFRRAADATPHDSSTLFEVAVSLADLGRQDESDAMLAAIEAMPEGPSHERLQLRRLQQCCSGLHLDAAMACLREFGALETLPSGAVSLAAGLLAARGDWDEVLALFAGRVVGGTGTAHVHATEVLAEAVARAARAKGRQADVLALLERWPEADSTIGANLRDQMAEELLVLHRVRPGVAAPAVMPAAPVRAERSARMAAALAQAGEPIRATVFMCSDLNYLPGTVVALSSVLRHNRAALRLCRFCVFLSADAMPVAAPMLERLGVAYGVRIELVSADALGRASTGFRRDWGSFTPGHRLSDAAYYRILAALWLAAQDDAGRAVYFDSDTCMTAGLAELLRFDLAGQPLGARLEESASGSIRRAAAKLGVAAEAYFNSGVLLLDLGHAACVPALQKAFEVAVGEPERLSFLDQCALNLAFHGRMAALPERYNSFVRHQGELAGDAVVAHYLSRPKPWDPAYATAAGARWLGEFYALADVLDAQQLRVLLGVPFQ